MRKIYEISLIAMFAITLTAKAQDAVKKANEVNDKTAKDNDTRKKVGEFLVKIADARMMDTREGEEAVKKGTTPAIREYGSLMVKDQKMLLAKIRQLAADRNILLPNDISDEKKDGFKDLNEKQKAEFDKKFAKMIEIDHERDIREFKAAEKLDDAGVQRFVSENLPLLESHLAKIKAIREKQ